MAMYYFIVVVQSGFKTFDVVHSFVLQPLSKKSFEISIILKDFWMMPWLPVENQGRVISGGLSNRRLTCVGERNKCSRVLKKPWPLPQYLRTDRKPLMWHRYYALDQQLLPDVFSANTSGVKVHVLKTQTSLSCRNTCVICLSVSATRPAPEHIKEQVGHGRGRKKKKEKKEGFKWFNSLVSEHW